jgi:predicted phage baseplate assembly protein
VTNPLPTWGGGEAPTQSEAEHAIAAFVRHRDRLVSPSDFVDVVRAAPGAEIGRVEVLPLVHPDLPGQRVPGSVTLLLLPADDPVTPEAPVPDQAFLRAVCRHVDERRLLTTELHLTGPVYEPVWASVGIDVLPGRPAGPVREQVKAAVRAFLSPLTGGHLGDGWPLSTPVSRLELVAVVARVDGVAKVFDVLVSGSAAVPVDQVPMPTTLHLPRLVGLEVRQGDPVQLADLHGSADTTAGLPVPTVPTECC